MSDTGKVAVGVIVGYGRPLNPFLKRSKVHVRLDYRIITVLVDQGQLEQVRSAHPIGGRVAVGFYGGEWHIGTPPAKKECSPPAHDTDDEDLLEREMDGIDLMSLVWRPDIESALSPPAPEQKASNEQDTFWEDLEKYTEYLKKVEQDMQDNCATILDRIGLSHLNALQDKNKLVPQGEEVKRADSSAPDHRLDVIIAQNKEILRLLKKISPPLKSEHRPKGKFN